VFSNGSYSYPHILLVPDNLRYSLAYSHNSSHIHTLIFFSCIDHLTASAHCVKPPLPRTSPLGLSRLFNRKLRLRVLSRHSKTPISMCHAPKSRALRAGPIASGALRDRSLRATFGPDRFARPSGPIASRALLSLNTPFGPDLSARALSLKAPYGRVCVFLHLCVLKVKKALKHQNSFRPLRGRKMAYFYM